jgi:Zn-dependent M28 family amino/carboxypeptidase
MVRPIFEEWLKPFADMGASTIAIRNTGGTDHLSFDRIGLPGFQFIQDEIEYDRGYHTTMDTYERLVMDDLKQNAIITASFVYNAAMRNAKLPGKPTMKPRLNANQDQRMQ